MEVGRPVRILPVIVLSQLAGTSLWFASNAILPDLQREWGLGERAVGTGSVYSLQNVRLQTPAWKTPYPRQDSREAVDRSRRYCDGFGGA